jgi:hypothetical protein
VIVLVSDTSVLIDLERGGFLDVSFRLDEMELVVPDLLYKRELADYGGPVLLDLGLKVVNLSAEELVTVQDARRGRPRLSLVDAYAFSLAECRQWTLLSGDAELRALAIDRRVPCVGVLWLLDRLFEQALVEATRMKAGLEAMAAHPRCRLPKAEVQMRLSRYST